MRLVILESPYAGDVEKHVAYARACVRDSLSRGEAPIASHLLYTQPGILRDEVSKERQWGIDAGLAWRRPRQQRWSTPTTVSPGAWNTALRTQTNAGAKSNIGP